MFQMKLILWGEVTDSDIGIILEYFDMQSSISMKMSCEWKILWNTKGRNIYCNYKYGQKLGI